jgi:hypothetical protein
MEFANIHHGTLETEDGTVRERQSGRGIKNNNNWSSM